MNPTSNNNKTEETKTSPVEKQKRIDAHEKIATFLETAAKHHHDAAKFHKENNNEKASKSAISAYEQLTLANETEEKETTKDALNIKK